MILNYSNCLIVHNDVMKSYFMSKNVPENKIVVLDIFDYLCNCNDNKKIVFSKNITIAGNLDVQKSPYIGLLNTVKNVKFNLYGPNYQNDDHLSNICYKGLVKSDLLPDELREGFGLVWDGTSIETCEGATGQYLRYNNPHKLSLYLVAGLPIVIWAQAAEASFVQNNNLGICVNSLLELEDALENVTEQKYEEYCDAVKKIRKKLCNGKYMQKAINDAILR